MEYISEHNGYFDFDFDLPIANDEIKEYVQSWLDNTMTLDTWIEHSNPVWKYYNEFKFTREQQYIIFQQQKAMFGRYVEEHILPQYNSIYENISENEKLNFAKKVVAIIDKVLNGKISQREEIFIQKTFNIGLTHFFAVALDEVRFNIEPKVDCYEIHDGIRPVAAAILMFKDYLINKISSTEKKTKHLKTLKNGETRISKLVKEIIDFATPGIYHKSDFPCTNYYSRCNTIYNQLEIEISDLTYTATDINAKKHLLELNNDHITAGNIMLAEDIMNKHEYHTIDSVIKAACNSFLRPEEFPRFLSFTFNDLMRKGILQTQIPVLKSGQSQPIENIHSSFYFLIAGTLINKTKQLFLDYQNNVSHSTTPSKNSKPNLTGSNKNVETDVLKTPGRPKAEILDFSTLLLNVSNKESFLEAFRIQFAPNMTNKKIAFITRDLVERKIIDISGVCNKTIFLTIANFLGFEKPSYTTIAKSYDAKDDELSANIKDSIGEMLLKSEKISNGD